LEVLDSRQLGDALKKDESNRLRNWVDDLFQASAPPPDRPRFAEALGTTRQSLHALQHGDHARVPILMLGKLAEGDEGARDGGRIAGTDARRAGAQLARLVRRNAGAAAAHERMVTCEHQSPKTG
jgi:hypothetical protein